MIQVQTKGLERVEQALQDSAGRIRGRMKATVRRAGLLVEAEAKEKQISRGGYTRVRRGGRTWIVPTPAPRPNMVFARRGGLGRSINVQVQKRGDTYISRTGTPLKYGAALEFGAPARTFPTRTLPLAVLANDPSAKGWRKVQRSGAVRARHWLQKALDAQEGAILDTINETVGDAL